MQLKQACAHLRVTAALALTRTLALTLTLTQASHAQTINPFEGDDAAIRAGTTIFASRCADCHGADAKGSRGPDLTQLWARGSNDRSVFDSIRNGREGSIMPPSFAPDEELWAVVAYLRDISTVAPFDPGRGNAKRGRTLFVEHCAGCHRVDGQGGALGPDLSRIAVVRSREALTLAIEEPSATVAQGYKHVTLRLRSGETVSGVAKSEDAFSIQVLDTDGRLQGYRKSDLRELMHETESLMPALWPSELNDRRLDDVIAYLGTLRGEAGNNE
jgi:putative heme-binding domain-containing protein